MKRAEKTHEAQSRGVPSATERPGMLTPLAPWISVTTPWAVTWERSAASAMTVERLKYILKM